MFAANVRPPTFVAQEAAKRMGQGSRIVTIPSSRAHFPALRTTGCAGSKAAMEMLTAIWAMKLAAKGVTANAVAPGPTSPGMIERALEALQTVARNSSPFGRLGSADEIANAVNFLCSEEAGWVTG